MKANIEIKEGGLKCDHCDYKDTTIPYESFPEFINKPCPKCGENLLTIEDYQNAVNFMNYVKFVNSLDEDGIKELTTTIEALGLKADVPEGVDPTKPVVGYVETHKELKMVITGNQEPTDI